MVDLEGKPNCLTESEKEPGKFGIQDDVERCMTSSHAALEERFLRLAADFDNYRKQSGKEKEAQVFLAEACLLREFLTVLDDLGRAIRVLEGPQAEGLLLVQKNLLAILSRHGVAKVECEGGKFNPSFHEALCSEPSDKPEGTILEVYETGYTRGPFLLRPAQVKIAGPGPNESR